MTPSEFPASVRTGALAATLAVVGLVAGACGESDSTTTADSTTTSANGGAAAGESAVAGQPGSAAGEYKNGEYSATGKYVSPGGPQQIGVTVTLANSVITALSLDTSNTKGTSKEFQGKFAGGIDTLVIGKNINDLDVSKVSGSSLTSGGFNDAIEQIKSEARA